MKRQEVRSIIWCLVICTAVFACCARTAKAQLNFDDLITTLSPALQDAIGDLIGSPTATTEDDETDDTPEEQFELPLGKDAIDYAFQNRPGLQVVRVQDRVGRLVRAAAGGEPIHESDEVELPEDEPDFWDRVKTVILTALLEAFLNMAAEGT